MTRIAQLLAVCPKSLMKQRRIAFTKVVHFAMSGFGNLSFTSENPPTSGRVRTCGWVPHVLYRLNYALTLISVLDISPRHQRLPGQIAQAHFIQSFITVSLFVIQLPGKDFFVNQPAATGWIAWSWPVTTFGSTDLKNKCRIDPNEPIDSMLGLGIVTKWETLHSRINFVFVKSVASNFVTSFSLYLWMTNQYASA